MKLPPLALTAPSLCPRCDAPAMYVDECSHCSLPIRQCGSCQGVAGPFDRFCGFCGHELVLGRKRSGAWRLWLLVALVPILVGLAIGLSPLGQSAARGITLLRDQSSGSPPPNVTDRQLGFQLTAPGGWTYQDLRPAQDLGVLVAEPADRGIAGGTAALVTATPAGTVVELGRASGGDPGVDASDPVAVLAFETAQLLASPPAGYTLSAVRPVSATRVAGRPAARTVVSIVGPGGRALVLEKVYVSTPGGGLLLFQALSPPDGLAAVDRVLASLRLTS